MLEKTMNYLFVKNSKGLYLKAYFKNIFYIETIKSSHYCIVRTKDCEYYVHADIKYIMQILPSHFYCCRSSTIVNLQYIYAIDLENRLIYFDYTIYCSFSNIHKKELKEKLAIFSYRNKGVKIVRK